MLKSSNFALPPLLFGNDRAKLHTNAQAFGDMVDAMFPGLTAYDPLPSASGVFRSKSDQIQLDGVSLMNASVSPTYVERKNNTVLTILLPIAGDPVCSVEVGVDSVEWGLAQGGVLLPIADERVVGSGGFRNQLMIQVDADRLQRQAQTMLGVSALVPDLMLDRLRPLSLYYGETSLLRGIVHTIPLLRDYADQPVLLNTLGVNELVLRQVAIMLRPDLFLRQQRSQEDATLSTKKALVQQLCEYMKARLAEPLTLGDLEIISGLSARTIQYAFQQIHDCSPMGWLRDQRLALAQSLLMGSSGMSITQIAQSCGFPNSSLFSASYRKRFGVTPSKNKH